MGRRDRRRSRSRVRSRSCGSSCSPCASRTSCHSCDDTASSTASLRSPRALRYVLLLLLCICVVCCVIPAIGGIIWYVSTEDSSSDSDSRYVGGMGRAGQGNTMVATFKEHGIFGSVTVDNGHVIVDLDLSSKPNLAGNYAQCISGGLMYHIHTKWTHTTYKDCMGADKCGGDYTGGHWDPWGACGPATDNEYCAKHGKCIDDAYSYDPQDVFSAEIGDWKTKYGFIPVDQNGRISRIDSDFFEVIPRDVVGMSVVFHCHDGTKAFCAPFRDSGKRTKKSVPEQGGPVGSVAADFGNGMVVMNNFGSIYTLKGNQDQGPIDIDVGTSTCTVWDYGIFEASHHLSAHKTGHQCNAYIASMWDPSHQCPYKSGSAFCTDSRLCNDQMYSYQCDFEDERYSCAPGDLSGKFGTVSNLAQFQIQQDGPGTLIPSMHDLTGKIFAVYCKGNGAWARCAPIKTHIS